MNDRFGILASAIAIGVTMLLFIPHPLYAGGTIQIDDTKSVSVGAGLRTSLNSVENGSPSGEDRSKDIGLDDIRLYVNSQLHESIMVEFNTASSSGDVVVLDAVVKLKFSDLFNIWAGRFLPPSDRSNLSGPYFLNAWDFPIAQLYPQIFAGRDDGAAVWGQVMDGKFKYQVGAFEGLGKLDAAGTGPGPNSDDNLLYAARLVVNLLDPEPGYYNSSTYYGSKDVIALGAVLMTQTDALGTVASPGDFTGWNVDVLAEKNLEGVGVVTLEGAYYDYDRDDAVDALGSVIPDSDGYFVLASFLLPQKVGIAQLQPMVRYQELETDGVDDSMTRLDLGLNYIIDGHNARVSLVYGDVKNHPRDGDYNLIRIGLQFQL